MDILFEGILPTGQADSEKGVKLEEQDDGYQHLSCTSRLVKKFGKTD
jgi:hypothetical protein